MDGMFDQKDSDSRSVEAKNHDQHGLNLGELEPDTRLSQRSQQKAAEVTSSSAPNSTDRKENSDVIPDSKQIPAMSPGAAAPVEQQGLPHQNHGDPAILQPKGIGSLVEPPQGQAFPRNAESEKFASRDVDPPAGAQDNHLRAPFQSTLFPENLTGQPRKDGDGSLLITPLDSRSYVEPRRADLQEAPIARTMPSEAQPKPSSPQISLGELAARLNQGDAQKSSSSHPSNIEQINAKPSDEFPLSGRSLSAPISEYLRPPVTNETTKSISNLADQRHEIPGGATAAHTASVSSEKIISASPSTRLVGEVSTTRDNTIAASPPTIANRSDSTSADRAGVSDKPKTDVDQKPRIDSNSTERSTKVDAGKIEAIDARTSKANGSASASSGSDLIKSNRTETFSTDKTGKTDKVDATKPHDDIKTRAEISNQTKREPLIIPGVITSRTSDSGKGGKGSKTDDSGKSDATKSDGKKTEGGIAGIKNDGTASDAAANRKGNIKVDKSDEKQDQHTDTKIAASTSNVISGVAGRIVDSLSTIKDKLIPGAKSNADSRSEKVDGYPEFVNHAAQPKPIDAGLGIGRDLKPLLPSSSGEFVYNGKKPLSDSREETLSNKTGGLKQALVQIFGNHPDIAADLKANTFPGPKTVPFENAQSKSGDKQTAKTPERTDKPSDTEITKKVDSTYLRNQKGDSVPTGNLCEELAELKGNSELTKPDDDFDLETKGEDVDSTNQQQIEDFTMQLGEIAIGAASVPPSEFFTADDTIEEGGAPASDEDIYNSRYLYYVKDGDTLRSIFDTQLLHEISNTSAFEYFVKINEQTIRLASVLSADSMSFILQVGTVLKLPTPRQLSQLK